MSSWHLSRMGKPGQCNFILIRNRNPTLTLIIPPQLHGLQHLIGIAESQ